MPTGDPICIHGTYAVQCGYCRNGSGGPPPGWWGAWPVYSSPQQQIPAHGCICPPTSEQTCQSPICPRRAVRATASALDANQNAVRVAREATEKE